MDLDTGVPVVSQPTSQDVDTAGLALAPGWGSLPSVLPGVVTTPAAGRDGVLSGDLLTVKQLIGNTQHSPATYRSTHRPPSPVELSVVNVALPLEQIYKQTVTREIRTEPNITSEQLPQIVVVRGLEEVESSHVSEIGGKFFWVTLAQDLDRSGPLGVSDLLVSLLQSIRLESLPGEVPAQEVHEHVTQSLQVITSALLFTQVSIY